MTPNNKIFIMIDSWSYCYTAWS